MELCSRLITRHCLIGPAKLDDWVHNPTLACDAQPPHTKHRGRSSSATAVCSHLQQSGALSQARAVVVQDVPSPAPLGVFFACASPQEAEGALSVGCVRPTPPWTPWLKVLGCCARAGPVAHSCPRIPVLQRLRSHVPRSVVPSCPLARAVRLDAPGSCKERAATRLDAFRFDLLLHAVGAPRATCCALASMAIGPATRTSAAIPRHAPS